MTLNCVGPSMIKDGEITTLPRQQFLKRRDMLVIKPHGNQAGVVQVMGKPTVISIVSAPAGFKRRIIIPEFRQNACLGGAFFRVA